MNINKIIAIPFILLMTINLGYAAVTQHDSAKSVKLDGVSATIDRPGVEKSPVDYKKNQLRCWQDGDLIVAENDWKLLDKSQAKVLHKANQKLYFYNFNETFCIYIED